MDAAHVIETVVVVLLTAVLVVPLFHRLRLSSVLGYLAAGAIIGPHGIGFIGDVESAQALAEFGVVFLLFTIGLELSVDRLKAMRKHIFGLGLLQVVLCGGAIYLGGRLFGNADGVAVVMGAALALSSTAVVLQILNEQGDMVARAGRVAFSILLFQDIAVAPILALVPLLADGGEGLWLALSLATVKGIAAVIGLLVLGRLVFQPVFHIAAHTGNREVFLALALLVALGTGWATHHVGLSMALGAFLAGLVLAGTEYRHQVEADIEPFRGLLLGFFFMTVGMIVDPSVIMEYWLQILVAVIALIVTKAAIIFALCRLFGIATPIAARVSLLLSEGGEFAFVICGLALAEGLFPATLSQVLIATIAITMMLTPFLASAGKRLQTRLEAKEQHAEAGHADREAEDLADHVVIAGFGRVGQTLARLLTEHRTPYFALDMDPARISQVRARGMLAAYGNAAVPEVLRRAGLDKAKALAVTLDDAKLAERVVAAARHEFRDLPIVARARDHDHAVALHQAGATSVVQETFEASLLLSDQVLRVAGAHEDEAHHLVTRARDQANRLLDESVPADGGSGTTPGRG